MEYTLQATHLSIEYGDFTLQDISLDIPRGSIVGLIGENGAGKSTTIRMLLGATGSRGSGEVVFQGRNLVASENEKLKNYIGVVFDDSCFSGYLNATNLDHIFADIYCEWSSSLFSDWLRRFSLPQKKLIKEYSRGMRMKLSLAVALSHGSVLLLLDEPTAGLDPIARTEVLDILQEFMLDDTHAILFSSHITTDLEKIADYIVFIHDGRIIFSEEKDVLLATHALCKGSNEQFEVLGASCGLVGIDHGMFGTSALCTDIDRMRELHPEFIYEPASIEEIMLHYVRQFCSDRQ
jgi:ABC-2 type transport system ATP-binding protein